MTSIPPFHEEAQAGLAARLDQIEARLAEVERRLGLAREAAAGASAGAEAGAELPALALPEAGSLPGLAGKSLLGLAAAYLLRALTESGRLAPAVGVALGLLYALAWLVWAARTPAAEALTVRVRALTSALILGPLLWEAHLRFQATTSWQTAAVLVLFAGMALAISWRKNQTAVALIGSLAGMLMSAAFLIRTHDVMPFTAGLLALAAAVEASACLEHYLGERWIVAGLANLAVLLLTYVATRAPGSLEGYAPVSRGGAIAAQAALVGIYLASTMVRTLMRGFRISVFELAQATAALCIGVWGALAVAQGHPRAVLAAGLFCAACGVLCYVVSFAFLERQAKNDRNFYSYATFGLALVLASSGLLLGTTLRALLWAVMAAAFVLAGRESGRMMLKLHAAIYAALAVIVSGMAARAGTSFLGSGPHGAGGATAAMWVSAAGAVVGYGFLLGSGRPAHCTAVYRAASALLGAAALWSLAGAGAVLAGTLCGEGPGVKDFCPTLLTAVLAAVAASAGFAFRRWRREELKWLAWLLTLVATYKVFVQDLPQAQAFAIVLSLLIYGALLIWMPRLTR
jgi:hypothetical protein